MRRLTILIAVLLLAAGVYALSLVVRQTKLVPPIVPKRGQTESPAVESRPTTPTDPAVFEMPRGDWAMFVFEEGRIKVDHFGGVTDESFRASLDEIRPSVERLMDALETTDMDMDLDRLKAECLDYAGPSLDLYEPQLAHIRRSSMALRIFAHDALENGRMDEYERAVLAFAELTRELSEQGDVLAGLTAAAMLASLDQTSAHGLFPAWADIPLASRRRFVDALRRLPDSDPLGFGHGYLSTARMNARILHAYADMGEDGRYAIHQIQRSVLIVMPVEFSAPILGEYLEFYQAFAPARYTSLEALSAEELHAVVRSGEGLIDEIEARWDAPDFRAYLFQAFKAAASDPTAIHNMLLQPIGSLVVIRDKRCAELDRIIATLEEN